MTDQGDLITALGEDHRALERALDELQDRRDGPARRGRLARQAIADLVRHAVAEEHYLYPLVRRDLPDGDARADREIGEHAEAERVMADLEQLDPDDHRFETLLAELIGQVRNHVAEEEHELFPRLAQAVPADVLRDSGSRARELLAAGQGADEQLRRSGRNVVEGLRHALG